MSYFNLKNTLTVDGITCGALFLLCVLGTSFVASLLGLPARIVTIAGWILLPSALLMVFVAAREVPNRALANLIALGNLAWVAASFVIITIFARQMTGLGIVLVAAQALGVLRFAILEAKGAAALGRR